MTKAKEEVKKDFTIEEAAEYLGVSKRTVERWGLSYTLQYRTGSDYISRETRIYSKSELDRAKAEQQEKKEKTVNVPGIMKVEHSNETVTREDLKEFAMFLISGIQSEVKQLAPAPTKQKKIISIAEIKDKGILNFKEALKLSGMTKDELTEALNNKQIKAICTEQERTFKGQKVISHIWKINRRSLDAFCENFGS